MIGLKTDTPSAKSIAYAPSPCRGGFNFATGRAKVKKIRVDISKKPLKKPFFNLTGGHRGR
ncbi:MAG: hypothetical protein ACLGG4_02550 [Gammaproteobacteria bacterium]